MSVDSGCAGTTQGTLARPVHNVGHVAPINQTLARATHDIIIAPIICRCSKDQPALAFLISCSIISRTALSTLFLLMPSRNRAIQQSLSLTYRYRNTLIGCTRRCQIEKFYSSFCSNGPRHLPRHAHEVDDSGDSRSRLPSFRAWLLRSSISSATTSSSSQRYTEPYPMSQTMTTAPWKLYRFRFLLGCGTKCWLVAAWGG